MIAVEIREEPLSTLADYASISIAFTIDSTLEVDGALKLTERPVAAPYVKDYDRLADNHPTDWPRRFDTTPWGRFAAYADGALVGAAIVAWGSPELELLGRGKELAMLFDLRVAPDARRRGVGQALFAAAEAWSRARGCRWLAIETQNNNVAACRFYAQRGCALEKVSFFAYPELPDEIQLLFFKPL